MKITGWAILWLGAASAVFGQPRAEPEPQQGPPPQQQQQGAPYGPGQGQPQRPGQQQMQPGQPNQGQQPQPDRRPLQAALMPNAPPGKWWHNPRMVMRLELTPEQQKKMDDVFQQSRLRLIDLNASLQREEAMLDPLVNGETLDDAKVLPQIDKVAQARAELEKANARLLLGIRHLLTPEQWRRLTVPGPVGPPNGPRE